MECRSLSDSEQVINKSGLLELSLPSKLRSIPVH
jgi:hypothetical protein